MGDKKIEDYVKTLNQLYKETGLLIESDTSLYEIHEPKDRNKVVAEIKWSNENKEYYARYVQ